MIRTFTSDLRRNITKILCLTIGMSVSMVLVAKIYYEKTYDLFFKDSERIYLVYEQFDSPDGTYDFDQTSGAYPCGDEAVSPTGGGGYAFHLAYRGEYYT